MRLKSMIMKPVWMMRKRRFLKSQPNTFGLSGRKLRFAYRHSFTPEEYVIYDLDNHSHKEYLSEFDRMVYRDMIRDKCIILDNKIVCYSILRNFAEMNKIYAYKLRGDKVSTVLDAGEWQGNATLLLEKCKKLVYKRISLGGGKGFKLLECTENGYSVNRQPCERADIEKLFSDTDDYLIEEYCEQSDFENQLFPYSVNTIRLITVIHKDGEIEPIVALQRMGMDAGKCVDNACAGGLYAQIELNTGKLSAARSHAKAYINQEFSSHPVTMAQIEGVVIPGWQDIVEKFVRLHGELRFTGLKFIAWDIALTQGGVKVIEANASCSMDFAQTFHGEKNGKIGAWMKEWGYIK